MDEKSWQLLVQYFDDSMNARVASTRSVAIVRAFPVTNPGASCANYERVSMVRCAVRQWTKRRI